MFYKSEANREIVKEIIDLLEGKQKDFVDFHELKGTNYIFQEQLEDEFRFFRLKYELEISKISIIPHICRYLNDQSQDKKWNMVKKIKNDLFREPYKHKLSYRIMSRRKKREIQRQPQYSHYKYLHDLHKHN